MQLGEEESKDFAVSIKMAGSRTFSNNSKNLRVFICWKSPIFYELPSASIDYNMVLFQRFYFNSA